MDRKKTKIRQKLTKPQLELWRLFFRFQGRIFQEVEQRLTQEKAIPLAWYGVLFNLWNAPHHRLRPSDLAEKLSTHKSTLSRLLDRLEEEKLIARKECPEDARAAFIELSRKGVREMAASWLHYEAVIQSGFFELLTESDQTDLKRILTKLTVRCDGKEC